MYVVGSSLDTVYQYALSTAWDVSTASYDSVSLSVSSQDILRRLDLIPMELKCIFLGLGLMIMSFSTHCTAWIYLQQVR